VGTAGAVDPAEEGLEPASIGGRHLDDRRCRCEAAEASGRNTLVTAKAGGIEPATVEALRTRATSFVRGSSKRFDSAGPNVEAKQKEFERQGPAHL
jgi:hypothetical protein